MSIIAELKLTISRTINLGNYENIKIEAGATVSRDRDDDSSSGMRDQLLGEVNTLFNMAAEENVPKRRKGSLREEA